MSRRFILIDGVCYEQALERLYMLDEELLIEPLYTNTPWQEVADLGPILLMPGNNSMLWEEVENGAMQHAAAILTSDAELSEVSMQLRQFNHLTDSQGNHCLLRYADPLVAWFWLGSFGAAELGRVMGPITHWRVVRPQASWTRSQATEWQEFAPPAPAKNCPADLLGSAQVNALNLAYRWQLKNRIYEWLRIHHAAELQRKGGEDMDAWLEACLQRAETSGLLTERSTVIWCALDLCQEQDFTLSEGTYQQWLKEQAGLLPPTPDQRLQQYYRFRMSATKGLSRT